MSVSPWGRSATIIGCCSSTELQAVLLHCPPPLYCRYDAMLPGSGSPSSSRGIFSLCPSSIMRSLLPSRPSYHRLKDADSVEPESVESLPLPTQTPRRNRYVTIITSVLLLVILLPLLTFGIIYICKTPRRTASTAPADDSLPTASSSTCTLRREWRTLSPAEQAHYISSVKCLATIPSTLDTKSSSTLYEDFPWIHSRVGYFTHNSAPFLPWHRYFLDIYEHALRSRCNFTGSLVYWDWTLDWEHLERAPVFSADPVTGFGSDGEKGGEITVGKTGRCVIDGAFTDITATYYDVKFKPHCLSRGFRDDLGNLGGIDGRAISPDSLAEVMRLGSYEDFVKEMESRVHDAIPFGIGGDFETFTAPYDPLFYLHHTQLDRLWYLWQQQDPDKRLHEYSGHNHRHSIEMAQLSDTIEMAGLAPNIQVQAVMDTERDHLCYRY